jgi:hypothetical protein
VRESGGRGSAEQCCQASRPAGGESPGGRESAALAAADKPLARVSHASFGRPVAPCSRHALCANGDHPLSAASPRVR